MEIDATYRGREHSLIKHKLLSGYLEKLLLIVGTSGTREITYVDCFAGPWGSSDDSTLAGTSIAASLDILKGVRNTLAAPPHRITNLQLRAIYVEENKSRHARLEEYLNAHAPSGIQCHALRGDYSALQEKILQLCGNGFAFFFIDPLGWTDVSMSRLDKLARRSRSELLITFMYDFLNRFLDVPELNRQVEGILGKLDDSDRQKLASLAPRPREAYVVRRYRECLKAIAGCEGREKPRAYHAVVKDKDKDRTKYHMVYVTRHPKGIIEFAEQSEKVGFIQHVVRIQKERDTSCQGNLFPAEEEAAQIGSEGVEIEVVERYWLSLLDTEARPFDEANLADMLEDTGWLIRDFQQAFGRLLAAGKVENIDARGKRHRHFVHFEQAERLRRTK